MPLLLGVVPVFSAAIADALSIGAKVVDGNVHYKTWGIARVLCLSFGSC